MKKFVSLALLIALCFTLTVSAEATKDPGLSATPVHVCAGDQYTNTAVIMADSSLWIWGNGRSSEDGHSVIVDEPVKVMENVRSVSIARLNTYAVITNDNVLWYLKYTDFVWNGRNNERVPPVFSEPEKVRENVLSYSSYFESFITTDHELRLFRGEEEWLIATDVVSAAGLAHAFEGSGYAIVHSDGSLCISGINNYGDGQEQHEENKSAGSFTKVMDDAVSVYGNENNIAVIKRDGSLWMWGNNSHGELGNGTTERSLVPVKVLDDVVAVDWSGTTNYLASSIYSQQTWGALRTDGSLWMWGWHAAFQGETGDAAYKDGMRVGGYIDATTPVKVLDDVVEFSCGGNFNLAVRSDGSLWGWGYAQRLKSGAGEFLYGGGGVSQILPIKLLDGIKTAEAIPQNSQHVTVTVKGEPVRWTDAVPFIDENSRTMVPLRAVADALGLKVDWDGAKREAVFSDETKSITFSIGSTVARCEDGSTKEMDTAAVIVNDRTYAPVRYLAEYFGYKVDWDGASKTVIIQ